VEFAVGIVGWALVLDFVGVYLMAAGAILCLLAIVPLEEKELRERFGRDYEEYAERVPRYLPRRRERG
jgi:protein-S-isoprenylcysteine O-methyltransferase Ste14